MSLIEIATSTDVAAPDLSCIGMSRPRRGRPKGSKSKHSKKKRRSIESSSDEDDSHDIYSSTASQPQRKKRKPNRTHRETYPNHTDEEIRRKLAMERKAKNRKSAQESRQRRKKQEDYLMERLPKGLALKAALLDGDKIQLSRRERYEPIANLDELTLPEALQCDAELAEMNGILEQMVDSFATEWEDYHDAQDRKEEIKQQLIEEILQIYLKEDSHADDDQDDDLVLETDTNPVHIQVIDEVEKGVPMVIDEIPVSATPITSDPKRCGRGRKPKSQSKSSRSHRSPSMHQSAELPPVVSDVVVKRDDEEQDIDHESAVFENSVPRDSMSSACHLRNHSKPSNQSKSVCLIKQEESETAHVREAEKPPAFLRAYPPQFYMPHPIRMAAHALPPCHPLVAPSHCEVLSSMSSTSSLSMNAQPPPHAHPASTPTLTPTPIYQPHSPLITSPINMAIMEHLRPLMQSPEQPHIQLSPISLCGAATHPTSMAMSMPPGSMVGNSGRNGRSFKNGNSSNDTSNGERPPSSNSSSPCMMDAVQEMKLLSQLIQLVQMLVVTLIGIQMSVSVHTNMSAIQQQYEEKTTEITDKLTDLVLGFMETELVRSCSGLLWRKEKKWQHIQQHVLTHYLPEMFQMICKHPLIPRQTMNVSCHYQAYRQIAMETLQNLKQQMMYYQHHVIMNGEMMTYQTVSAQIEHYNQMMLMMEDEDEQTQSTDTTMDDSTCTSTSSTCIKQEEEQQQQQHSLMTSNHCLFPRSHADFFEDSPMDQTLHSPPQTALPSTNLVCYKQHLHKLCFNILANANNHNDKMKSSQSQTAQMEMK